MSTSQGGNDEHFILTTVLDFWLFAYYFSKLRKYAKKSTKV